MRIPRVVLIYFFIVVGFLCAGITAQAQVTIAQLSDVHIGEKHAPHALENLKRAVDMINRRKPDAVVLSGDIGESPEAWEQARSVLRKLHAPLYIAPGNHDVHTMDVERYRRVFGNDYYQFKVKGVKFVVIDSQLLGNFEQFNAKEPPEEPDFTRSQTDRMISWLDRLPSSGEDARESRGDGDDRRDRDDRNGGVVIGIQHIPVFRDDKVLPDPKPYWVISEPYRSEEMKLLKRLGIRHMLVGHWHVADVFERGGITWHVAPATSWLPWGGELGFAMHTITPDGEVRTEFVSINAQP